MMPSLAINFNIATEHVRRTRRGIVNFTVSLASRRTLAADALTLTRMKRINLTLKTFLVVAGVLVNLDRVVAGAWSPGNIA